MQEYKVKELLTIRNGRDHKQLANGKFPVYGSGGIMRYVDSYLYDKPSILLPRKGTLNNIQYCEEPFWCVDTTYYSEINQSLANPYYLYRYLSLLNLKGLDSGSVLPSMTFDSYYQIKVFLPSIEVQNLVGKLLYDIDQKISHNTRINAELEAMAKQLYDYWFVQFDFPDENGKPYKSSGGKMVYNEKLKKDIPEGWDVIFADEVCNVVTGKEDANFAVSNGEYAFFTCSQTVLRCNENRFDGSAVLIAGNGDFNVKHYTGKFNAYQRTYVLIPHNRDYYGILFFSAKEKIDSFHKNSNGSIVKFITLSDVEGLYVYKQLDEGLYTIINNIIFEIEKRRLETDYLNHLRDYLLPMLMNGQVTVE